MNKSKVLASTIIVLAVVGVVIFYLTKQDSPTNTQTNANQTAQSSNTTQTSANDNNQQANETKTITKAEVAQHTTSSDCWTIISGNVYDITSYIPRHSGGNEILRACGIDSTTLFTQRETSSGEQVGTGTPHSSSAESDLKSLQIGIVAN